MTIVQLAGDTERLLGWTHDQLLGQSLNGSLGAAALDRVESMIRNQQLLPRPFFIIEVSFDDRSLDIFRVPQRQAGHPGTGSVPTMRRI